MRVLGDEPTGASAWLCTARRRSTRHLKHPAARAVVARPQPPAQGHCIRAASTIGGEGCLRGVRSRGPLTGGGGGGSPSTRLAAAHHCYGRMSPRARNSPSPDSFWKLSKPPTVATGSGSSVKNERAPDVAALSPRRPSSRGGRAAAHTADHRRRRERGARHACACPASTRRRRLRPRRLAGRRVRPPKPTRRPCSRASRPAAGLPRQPRPPAGHGRRRCCSPSLHSHVAAVRRAADDNHSIVPLELAGTVRRGGPGHPGCQA